MAIEPTSATDAARLRARRLRLTRHQVYACRECRAAIRVTSALYLPVTCEGCGASTWDRDGRCAAPGCDGRRRPGVRGAAHCRSCGHSVWTLVSVAGPQPRG